MMAKVIFNPDILATTEGGQSRRSCDDDCQGLTSHGRVSEGRLRDPESPGAARAPVSALDQQ